MVSCTKDFSKYESNWLIENFTVEGQPRLNKLGLLNFRINISRKIARPPSYTDEYDYEFQSKSTKIKILNRSNNEYIRFINHEFLTNDMLIKCLDEECCEVEISDNVFYFHLLYNGDFPFGNSRPCIGQEI